ncbi:MAG: TRAP transporter small permease [Desulfomicrobiaceae bacterium]|nr:TRAP transporter small permease [Desulfomicrobiaceae bacterium]
MQKVQEMVVRLTRAVATAAVLLMMAVTVVSVVGRLVGTPLFGAEEMVAFLCVAVVAASLPYCQEHRAHIGVELVVRRLSPRWQRRLKFVRDLGSLGLWLAMAWAVGAYAVAKCRSSEVSLNLGWPEGAVVGLLAAGLAVTALLMVAEFIHWLRRRDA